MLTYKKYTTNTARAGTVFSKAGCTAAYLFVGIAIVLAGVVLQPHSAFAADISVTPITWDIIGLDSNDPQTGPNQFPVGVRVCNNTAGDATNVTGTFQWDIGGDSNQTSVISVAVTVDWIHCYRFFGSGGMYGFLLRSGG